MMDKPKRLVSYLYWQGMITEYERYQDIPEVNGYVYIPSEMSFLSSNWFRQVVFGVSRHGDRFQAQESTVEFNATEEEVIPRGFRTYVLLNT